MDTNIGSREAWEYAMARAVAAAEYADRMARDNGGVAQIAASRANTWTQIANAQRMALATRWASESGREVNDGGPAAGVSGP